MHNALRMSRRAFTVAVVAATIAWSIGLAALVTPLTANAASSGDLVKGSLPAVYYVGADGKRYVFPNKKTYDTWYSDFSGVMTITDAELAAMPIGGNATYRPGVKMIKIQTDPKVYAVDANGTLRWVADEATAIALYGSNWNQMIDDVPDAFFVNYTIGADVSSASDFNAANATSAASSINADKNLAASASGDLSVMLSSGQPAGGTLPLGAMGVNLLKVDVHNGGSSATIVDSVTFRRTGAGVSADWAAVYVYHGNDRLTTGRTINSSSHEVTVGGLNLSVAAGGMETLWLAGDVAASGTATAGNVHSFELSALTSGSVLASGAPLMGSTFTLSGASAGTVTVDNSGTISNVKAGENGAKLAQFYLETATEDQNVSKVALFYNGTVTRDNLSNFVLKQNGVTVATASSINSKDQLVFLLSPAFEIERGNQRTFEVYGDVSGSARAAQTVAFYVDQTADVLSVGQTYGYGARVTNNFASGDQSTTVEAGKLNISYNGPAASNIAPRQNDVEIFNVTLTPQSNLELRTTTFSLAFTGGAAAADFSDLKLVDTATGQIVAGPYTPASGSNAMTEVINLTSGVSRTFKLTVDVESTLQANEIITATLSAFGSTAVRNLDNSTYLTPATDIVPSGAIVGNAHTGQVASLTVTAGSVPVAQTYIKGSSGVSLAGIGLTASDAMDITVSQVVLTGYIDTNDATSTCTVAADGTLAQGTENTSCDSVSSTVLTAKLMNGSTQVGATKSPSSSSAAGSGGTLTFDNLNLVVPAGQTVGLELVGDLAAGLTSANLPYSVRFDVAASSVTASDPDGNTVSQSGTSTGSVMSVANSGSLYIERSADDTDTEAGNLVGGTSNAVLAKYKFTAENEELKVTKMGFTLATANTVSSISLYDGTTLVGGPKGVTSGGVVNFTGLNFVVPKDGSKTLTVKANLNSVGAAGATSGTAATITLAATTGTFEARGTSAGSSTVLTDANDADGSGTPYLTGSGSSAMVAVAGNAKIVRKTKPTVSLVTLPSSTLIAGDVVAMRIQVAADAAGPVALKKIAGTVTEGIASGSGTITVDGVRRTNEGSNLTATTDLQDSGDAGCTTDETTCTFKAVFTSEEVIPAGETRSYDIRLNVAGTLASGDTLSMSLLSDTALVTGELETAAASTGIDDYDGTAGSAEFNFIWSDMYLVAHNDTIATNGNTTDLAGASNDWTNGLYVKLLPSDSQTLSK